MSFNSAFAGALCNDPPIIRHLPVHSARHSNKPCKQGNISKKLLQGDRQINWENMPVGSVRWSTGHWDRFFRIFFEQLEICDQSDLNPIKEIALGKFFLCTAKFFDCTGEVFIHQRS